jgi:hypothetical protein
MKNQANNSKLNFKKKAVASLSSPNGYSEMLKTTMNTYTGF